MADPKTENKWLEDVEEPKPLGDINEERQLEKDLSAELTPEPILEQPPVVAPAEPQAPVQPIQDKDLAKLLEDAAKALLDASLSIEKATVNLKKILIKLGPGDDLEESKVDGIISSINDMSSKSKAISQAISEYRESIISGNK